MQTIENEEFRIGFDEKGSIRVVMKTAGVEVSIEALRAGLVVYGRGYQPYIALGRDSGMLVLDKELLGMESIPELRR